ncbi:hypothetical protein NLM33_19540 [Bradyrhizobium sp. CCGUVB1N3]|uniref:hypothetical protein n=1 Tax=Bradyrhizobium sp. CCGUVB1N3 TaxID=2949629 RepID=UPI0020B2F2F9|nr:hypothetical protein [Bradyrhizobium sp. CCGUVB1N3]MCP3472509.1 hypothetical protein [Bradyrhizobium sp. CCGUVB1N3]
MLPGFRFLLAAILLSTSILVFGLGAAALLRATHEQFVSNPSWRNGPQEQVFAQASEPAQPVLAVFRAEPLPSSTSVRDDVPTVGLPESGPEQVAALTSEVSSEPVALASETAAAEAPSPPAETPAPQSASAETTPSTSETMPATGEAVPTPVAAAEPQQADAASSAPSSDTRIEVAALADPATAVAPEPPPAKVEATSDTADKQATKRPAHRAKKRHRIVRRPPPPPVMPVQQTFNPFATQPLQQYQYRQQYQQPAYAATTRAR